MPRKPEDLLEAAMGLVSNSHDWLLLSTDSDNPSNIEWRVAARKWLDEYQTWLKQYLLEENSKMPNFKIDVDPDMREKIDVALSVATKGVELWHETLGRFRGREELRKVAFEEGYRMALRDTQTEQRFAREEPTDMVSESPTMRPDSDISPDEWDQMELSAARYVEQAQRDLASTLRDQREVQKRRWSARVR
jgi:hypothetical protein